MATSMDDMYMSLEEFEKELTCGICLEQYTEPKVLPCLHYYCKKCIVKMALKKNLFSCPECCKEVEVTSGKEDELPPAHFINRLGELVSKQKKALSKEVSCEICTDSCVVAEAFCKQCGKFVCTDCIESHSRMKALFEGHQIISLAEVRHVEADELVPPPIKRCKTHNEQQKMYCFQCKALICRDCVLIDHKDHKIEFSKKVAAAHRESLLQEMKEFKELKLSLSEAVKEVQATAKEIQTQGSTVAKSIGESFEKLQRTLLDGKVQLLDEVEHRVREKMANLKKQEESLNEAGTEFQSILDYTEQCIKYCSDEELTAMFGEIESQKQRRIDSFKEKNISVDPVEEVDICANIDCSEKLQELCLKNAHVAQIPVKVLPLNLPNLVLSGATCMVFTIIELANGKQLKGDPTVKSLMKLKEKILAENTVKRVGRGRYLITYTPTCPGENQLLVAVENNDSKHEFAFPIKVFDLPSYQF